MVGQETGYDDILVCGSALVYPGVEGWRVRAPVRRDNRILSYPIR